MTEAPKRRQEHELLLLCARTWIDPQEVVRIKTLLGEGIDWAFLSSLARRHAVAPLLFCALRRLCPEAVPAEILESFEVFFEANRRRNLFLTGQLCRILAFFDAHGICAIPYKGPALAVSAYRTLALRKFTALDRSWVGNERRARGRTLALRQFADLDLIVDKTEMWRSKEILSSLGYHPNASLTATQMGRYVGRRSCLSFSRHGGSEHIDLHCAILPSFFSFPVDFPWLLNYFDRAETEAGGFPMLRPEALLILLCAHGAKHHWERLGWICDVAALLRHRQDLDWPHLLALADQLRSRRMVLLGLSLAHDLLGTSLPHEIGHAVGSVRTLGHQVRNRLSQHSPGPQEVVADFFFYLKTREDWKDRLRCCIRISLAISERDCAVVSLPPSLFFLYYVIRAIRLGTAVMQQEIRRWRNRVA